MQLPKVVINSENLKIFTEAAEKSLGKYVFGGVLVFLFLAAVISILLYTVCMHWIIAIWFKTHFTQTLFINSLTYIILALLGFFSPINLGVFVNNDGALHCYESVGFKITEIEKNAYQFHDEQWDCAEMILK